MTRTIIARLAKLEARYAPMRLSRRPGVPHLPVDPIGREIAAIRIEQRQARLIASVNGKPFAPVPREITAKDLAAAERRIEARERRLLEWQPSHPADPRTVAAPARAEPFKFNFA